MRCTWLRCPVLLGWASRKDGGSACVHAWCNIVRLGSARLGCAACCVRYVSVWLRAHVGVDSTRPPLMTAAMRCAALLVSAVGFLVTQFLPRRTTLRPSRMEFFLLFSPIS